MNASELVALLPATEALGPKEREVPRLAGDQLEVALARLNRLGMMGDLAASLAHEIITQPIAADDHNHPNHRLDCSVEDTHLTVGGRCPNSSRSEGKLP